MSDRTDELRAKIKDYEGRLEWHDTQKLYESAIRHCQSELKHAIANKLADAWRMKSPPADLSQPGGAQEGADE